MNIALIINIIANVALNVHNINKVFELQQKSTRKSVLFCGLNS